MLNPLTATIADGLALIRAPVKAEVVAMTTHMKTQRGAFMALVSTKS